MHVLDPPRVHRYPVHSGIPFEDTHNFNIRTGLWEERVFNCALTITNLIGFGARISGELPGLLFHAPLTVDVTPAVAAGSPTPSFSRTGLGWFPRISDGQITEAASGAERIDQYGLIIEALVTNDCLHNRNFGDAVWVKPDVSVTDNTVASPDGGTNADTLTADAGNATIIQDLGTISSGVRVFSLYLKRKTGTGNVEITLDGGSTWTNQTINSSTWTRVWIKQTVADPDVGVRIVTSGDAVYAWGGQHENGGRIPREVIYTDGSSVTKNEDDLTYAASGNVVDGGGTMVVTATYPILPSSDYGSPRFLHIKTSGGSSSDFIETHAFWSAGRPYCEVESANVDQVNMGAGGGVDDYSAATPKIQIVTYDTDDFELFSADGTGAVSRNTDVSGSLPVGSFLTIQIGKTDGGNSVSNARIRHVRFYNRILTSGDAASLVA